MEPTKRKYRKMRNKLERCVLRIPKYLIPLWEKKIDKSKVSTAKFKTYQYGFTIAVRLSGINSADEFLGVVRASQVHFSHDVWLQQVYEAGCGCSTRTNAHKSDVAKAKLLDKWRQTLPETSQYRASAPTAPTASTATITK